MEKAKPYVHLVIFWRCLKCFLRFPSCNIIHSRTERVSQTSPYLQVPKAGTHPSQSLKKRNLFKFFCASLSRKETPQKLTQLSSRSHPRHLVGKRTAQKDTIKDITSDSQVNSNFPDRWSPASLTFNNYFYLFLYLYIT